MNAHRCSISRALPLVLLFGMVTLSCAQDGPHIIYTGPGAGAILNASGGLVNQPSAVGVIAPPNPVAGVFDFNFQGVLNGLPNPDPLGAGWGLVAPFVPPPGGGGPVIGPGAGADVNLPFTPGGLLQLNFDPTPGNDPGAPFAPPVFIYDPNGSVIEVNGVKIDVVPLNNPNNVFGFGAPPGPNNQVDPNDKFAELQSGAGSGRATIAEVQQQILDQKAEEAAEKLKNQQLSEAAKIQEVREETTEYYRSQAVLLDGSYYRGVFVPFATRDGAIAIRTARIGELIQSLALLNLINPGSGNVPAGSFLATMEPGDSVKKVQELTHAIANGSKKAERDLLSYLATPGVNDDGNFDRLRKDLLTSLYEIAQQLQIQENVIKDARISLLGKGAAIADPFAPVDVTKAIEESHQLEAKIAQANQNILKLLDGNALLTVPVKVGGFEGSLWQALIHFSGNTTLSQTAINEAIPALLNHIRDEIVRLGGLTTTEDLIGEFGSPVYAPLRNEILGSPTFATFTTPRIQRGVADVGNVYAQASTANNATDKATDAAFAIAGGIVVIGAVVFTGPLGAAIVAGTGATLGAAEAGVEGYRTYVAYGDSAAAESAVNAGGGTSREAAQNFHDILTGQAITFAITTFAVGLDVADVRGAVKAARGAANEAAETTAAAGTKAGAAASDAMPPKAVADNSPLDEDLIATRKEDLTATQKNSGSPTVRVDESKFTPSTTPGANTKWTDPETGRTFLLGKQLGAGAYNTVFEIADQPGLVIKFPNKVLNPPPNAGADFLLEIHNEILEVVDGSKILAEAGIPQVKVVDANLGKTPYIVTERLDPAKHTTVKYSDLSTRRDELIAQGKWTKEHEHAVVELFDNLAQKEVGWADGHVDNLYFFRGDDGRLHAGILDHDQIDKFGGENIKVQNALFTDNRGLGGGTSPHQALFNVLARKQWISVDKTGKISTNLLDPNTFKEFPGFAELVDGKTLSTPSFSRPGQAGNLSGTVRGAVTFGVTQAADEVIESTTQNSTSGSSTSSNPSQINAQPIVLPAKINEVRHQNDVQNARMPQRQPSPGRRIKLGSLIPRNDSGQEKPKSDGIALAN